MEKVYQSVGEKGLQIPLVLMQQYGLEQGSSVVLEMTPEGIRIVPARPDHLGIENRALRYLLTSVGDGVTVEASPRLDQPGWQVDVYGIGMNKPAGKLIFDESGRLLEKDSTPPREIRRTFVDSSRQS